MSTMNPHSKPVRAKTISKSDVQIIGNKRKRSKNRAGNMPVENTLTANTNGQHNKSIESRANNIPSMVKINHKPARSKQNAEEMNKSELSIGCAACLRQFTTRLQLSQHVSSNHAAGDNVISLFFNNIDEFTTWKMEVECNIPAKYHHDDAASLGRKLYDNAPNTYSCNAKAVAKATPMKQPLSGVSRYYCPSGMIVQIYNTGVHVLYYKGHNGHSCPTYTVPERYKNNVTSNLIYTQWHNRFLESPEVSLLTKFNILMNAIANGAEEIPEENLRMLHGKTIEMMLMMNRPNEDRQENISKYVGQKVKQVEDLEKELIVMNKSRSVKPKLQEQASEIKLQKKETKHKVVMPKPLKSGHAFCLNDIESELKEQSEEEHPILDTDSDGSPQIKKEKDEMVIEEYDLEDMLLEKKIAAPKTHNPRIVKQKTHTPRIIKQKPLTPRIIEEQTQTPKQPPITETPEIKKVAQTSEISKPWLNNSPSSFNDTYKSFLEQTIHAAPPFKGPKDELGKKKRPNPPSLLKQRKIKTKLGFQPLLQSKKMQKKCERIPVKKRSSSPSSSEVKIKVDESKLEFQPLLQLQKLQKKSERRPVKKRSISPGSSAVKFKVNKSKLGLQPLLQLQKLQKSERRPVIKRSISTSNSEVKINVDESKLEFQPLLQLQKLQKSERRPAKKRSISPSSSEVKIKVNESKLGFQPLLQSQRPQKKSERRQAKKRSISPSSSEVKIKLDESKLGFKSLLQSQKLQKKSERRQAKKRSISASSSEVKNKVDESKLGFKPLLQSQKLQKKSERKPAKKRSISPSSSEVKIKVDEYEVMEQENDCNILILKF